MSLVAFAVFLVSIPLAMALGMRFPDFRPAMRAVAWISGSVGLVVAVCLSLGVAWMGLPTLVIIWLIATITPLALGMAAWRTPDLIDSMDHSFNEVVEPYLGHPVSLLGWAHAIFNLLPSSIAGKTPEEVISGR